MHNLLGALRALRNAPGLSALVVLILAVGIGANTSVFTVINAALLRPLPYRDAKRLVSVTAIDRSGGTTDGCLSYPRFQLIATHSRSFASIAAYTNETFSIRTGGEPIEAEAARVSSNFFALLGVAPAFGRTFAADESKPGAKSVALISTALWHQRFHGRRDIVGTTIGLDSKAYTVIGVLPASFQFGLLGNEIAVWTPRIDELNLVSPQGIQGGTCYLDAVAQLAPGVSIDQAKAEMSVLDRQYVRDFPKLGDADPKRPVDVMPLRTRLVGNYKSLFVILSAAVALVAFIACANAAGLLLSAALKRRREVAIRIALGAPRRQLLLLFLSESVTLALLGGVAGVLLSLAVTRLLTRMATQTLPGLTEMRISMDISVLVFALFISLLCGILCGLVPALQFANTDVSSSLREEGRGTVGARTRNFARTGLVIGQIAISLVLLVCAGLLVRSFIVLETESPGFNSRGVVTMTVSLPPSRYPKPEQMDEFFNRLVPNLEVLPGVKAAAVSSALPLNVARLTPILVEGQPEVPLPERPIIIVQTFTASYLRVMQIPLKAGRFFNIFDTRGSMPVIVVNESFARKFFPDQNPIGKHVWIGRQAVPAQIVGVIGNIKNVGLSIEPQPEFDVPFSQLPWGRMNVLIRTAGNPNNIVAAARHQITNLDPDLPVTDVRTLDELVGDASTRPRLIMLLLMGFSLFAFALATVGLYGAISYSVAQRTQEMGVRVALGATRGDVLRLVLGYATLVSCTGICIGLGCLLFLTDAMEKLVYGISTKDPLTFTVVSAAFFLCALVASYVPARRATRVDVMEALRQ